MENSSIVFIGMDTHKEITDVSYALEGRDNQPQYLGRIATRKQAVTKLVRPHQARYPHATLHFCYEAGPCGYWLYRLLSGLGIVCHLAVRSLIPKKPGERVKRDKRDSLIIGNRKLTQLLKSGDLNPINAPVLDPTGGC